MSALLSILKAILSIADWLTKKAHDKQLLDAGAAASVGRNLERSHARIQKAINARRAADSDSVRDPFTRD